jgi:DNA anti-recombination protein RmuC
MTGVPSSREVVTFLCGDPTAPQTEAINVRDATMNIVKPIAMGSAEASSEMELGGNIRELARGSAAFRQAESSDDEMSASSLDTLLGRVSENSTREIENLIGELQRLHKKLQTDRNRVQRYIAEYAAMNQQVMQLTKIIFESVKKLPDAPGISA